MTRAMFIGKSKQILTVSHDLTPNIPVIPKCGNHLSITQNNSKNCWNRTSVVFQPACMI